MLRAAAPQATGTPPSGETPTGHRLYPVWYMSHSVKKALPYCAVGHRHLPQLRPVPLVYRCKGRQAKHWQPLPLLPAVVHLTRAPKQPLLLLLPLLLPSISPAETSLPTLLSTASCAGTPPSSKSCRCVACAPAIAAYCISDAAAAAYGRKQRPTAGRGDLKQT